MLGRQELKELELEKRALVAQSGLNRLTLQAEIQNLRAAVPWARQASHATGGLSPLLTFLGPIGGFLLTRGSGGMGVWLRRLTKTAGLILPLYRLWKAFAARRKASRES